MTMRFNTGVYQPTATDGALRMLFLWLDWMRTASPTGPGWSIPRSSDGATGGAGDNIVDFNDLTTWVASTNISWFVLRAPDSSKEFLWSRYNTSDQDWQVRYSPTGAFTGGDETIIPTAPDSQFFHQVRIHTNDDAMMNMAADDATPYGYYMWAHTPGNFAACEGCWCWIPLDTVPAGDTDPYVHYLVNTNFGGDLTLAYLYDEDNSSTFTRAVSILPGSTTTNTTPALVYRNSGGNVIPSDLPTDNNGADLTFPIPFGRSAGIGGSATGFKGISTFMQWNGTVRAPGQTFAARTRISWGDVNLPWDGSVPQISP
jgi:hypothetical protein